MKTMLYVVRYLLESGRQSTLPDWKIKFEIFKDEEKADKFAENLKANNAKVIFVKKYLKEVEI